MRALVQVLKKVYQDYAVIYPPAEAVEVSDVYAALIQNGYGRLPADYRTFLMMTDGLFWNGLELFSTREHERNNGAFFHRAIIQSQALFSKNTQLNKKIVLGMAPEELIVYDAVRKEYQLVDRYSYTIFVKFPSFSDILYFYIRNVVEK